MWWKHPKTATFYFYDGLGSTERLVDDSGATTDTYEYDVFGAQRSSTGSSDQPFRFTGEYQDVGVVGDPYYLRERMYAPELGRFLTTDPWSGSLGNPQSANAYAYVGNNPATFIDPLGLCPTGQVHLGPVPTPPPPVATPAPSGASATPAITAEGHCSTLLQGGGPGFTVIGWVNKNVLRPTWAFVTSDCVQGIAKVGTVSLVVGASVFTGVAAVQGGALVTTSVGTTIVSGTAIGAAAAPVGGTPFLVRIGGLLVSGAEQLGECG